MGKWSCLNVDKQDHFDKLDDIWVRIKSLESLDLAEVVHLFLTTENKTMTIPADQAKRANKVNQESNLVGKFW